MSILGKVYGNESPEGEGEEIKENIPEPTKYVDFRDPNFIMALNNDKHPDNKNVK